MAGGADCSGWYASSYDPNTASIRIRLLQPLAWLQQLNLPVEIYRPENSAHYTSVLFSKTYDDRALDLARSLRNEGKRVIFDICDNHFFGADQSQALTERAARLRQMLNLSSQIVTSTETLADQLRSYIEDSSVQIHVIPDALTAPSLRQKAGLLQRFALQRLSRFVEQQRSALRLVWFGNRGVGHAQSGLVDLLRVRDVIEAHHNRRRVSLTVISNSYSLYKQVCHDWSVPTHYMPWALQTIDAALSQHDVAIIPIARNPFTVAKTNNRPATAMLAGLGVIADSIPSYEELRPYVVLDDWMHGLDYYSRQSPKHDPALKNGRNYLLEHYSPEKVFPKWRTALQI